MYLAGAVQLPPDYSNSLHLLCIVVAVVITSQRLRTYRKVNILIKNSAFNIKTIHKITFNEENNLKCIILFLIIIVKVD
jgi:hypothetical protein